MEETQKANKIAREAFADWQGETRQNIYKSDKDFIHTIKFFLADEFANFHAELEHFGEEVASHLEPLVNENNLAINLPRLEQYNAIGERIDKIVYHPTYVQAGDIIYRTELLAKMLQQDSRIFQNGLNIWYGKAHES